MKITEPGVYEIPMSTYHSDCCPGPSISSSGLRKIALECPAEYWAFSYLNPDAFPEGAKVPFSFGRAAHCLLLGDEDFNEHYAVRPEKWSDWRKAEARRWKADQQAAGKTVITLNDLADITHMARVMEQHPLTEILLQGQIEKSLIWQDAETGVWLKARPDIIPTFDQTFADYKTTTSRCQPYQLSKTITDFGYHMQMALVAEGAEILLDIRNPYAVLIFQQVQPPYHVIPVEVTEAALDLGRKMNRKAIQTFADCLEKGEWPGYADGIPQYHPTEWQMKQVEEV